LGEDYIIISKQNAVGDKTFYISVYCKEECGYELSIKLDSEVEFGMNVYNLFRLKKDEELILKFKNTASSGFEFFCYSFQMLPFKLYMDKGNY